VEVRDSAGGAFVEDLDVRCNGVQLTLTGSTYTGDPGEIVPGEIVTFTISDGASQASAAVEVPQAPTGLALQEGEWDFSDDQGSHTLTWTNPATPADSILVALTGRFVHPMILATHSAGAASSATSITIANTDMSDFAGTISVECAVFQQRRGELAGHSGESLLWARAAATETWPVR
jgi:hypothetical protein